MSRISITPLNNWLRRSGSLKPHIYPTGDPRNPYGCEVALATDWHVSFGFTPCAAFYNLPQPVLDRVLIATSGE